MGFSSFDFVQLHSIEDFSLIALLFFSRTTTSKSTSSCSEVESDIRGKNELHNIMRNFLFM